MRGSSRETNGLNKTKRIIHRNKKEMISSSISMARSKARSLLIEYASQCNFGHFRMMSYVAQMWMMACMRKARKPSNTANIQLKNNDVLN